MPERYELLLDDSLATILERKLTEVLKAAGFQDTLHLANPHVTQFQGRSGIVSVEVDHLGSHKRRLIVDSESVALAAVLWEAGKQTISDLSDEVLGALPWVDNGQLREKINECLEEAWTEPS